jgi:hypothetical protein
MFVLKKIVTLLMTPMSICLGVLGVGILLLWVRRRIGAAKIVLTLGFLTLTALSFSAVANQIIKPLELWYPPLLDTNPLKDVKWVVSSDRLRGLDAKGKQPETVLSKGRRTAQS